MTYEHTINIKMGHLSFIHVIFSLICVCKIKSVIDPVSPVHDQKMSQIFVTILILVSARPQVSDQSELSMRLNDQSELSMILNDQSQVSARPQVSEVQPGSGGQWLPPVQSGLPPDFPV